MVFVLVSRVVQNVVGYVWPAYLCYKCIEARQAEGIRDWCIYWFVLALFTILERVLDAFLFWMPLYYPAKVAFVVYLWHPKTLGAKTLYGKTVRPALNSHEAQIDQALDEARVWLAEYVLVNKQKLLEYARSAATELMAIAHKGTGQEGGNANGVVKKD